MMNKNFWWMVVTILSGCTESLSYEENPVDSMADEDIDNGAHDRDSDDPPDTEALLPIEDDTDENGTAGDEETDTGTEVVTIPDTDEGTDAGIDTDSEAPPAADPCAVPEGFVVQYCVDYETDLKAANYLTNDVWWFYDGGNATSYNNPELDKRFIIVQDPLNSTNRTIQIIKFDGDKDTFNQNLNPRAELSLRPSQEHSASLELLYRMKTFFPADQAGVFSAEFTQFWLHGSSNIPLQIEVRNGEFKARRPGKTPVTLNGSARLSDNVGRWIEWEVQARFNSNGGYWRIYKDGLLAYEQQGDMQDWPDNSGTWHTQYGVYANNGGAGTMTVMFDDYVIATRRLY